MGYEGGFSMPTVNHKELKSIVKASVKEVLEEEPIKVRLLFFPEASAKEMQDIASRYGKPEKKSVRAEKIQII